MKDRAWRAQMEAELVALRRRLDDGEAVLAELRPAAAPQSRSRPKGQAPFGWRHDETDGLIAVPEQQAAIRQMRRMKDRGLSLQEIAAAMRSAEIKISHMTVKNVLDAAARDRAAGELIEGRHVYVHDLFGTALHESPHGVILLDVLLDLPAMPNGVDQAWQMKHYLGAPVPGATMATVNLAQAVTAVEFVVAEMAEPPDEQTLLRRESTRNEPPPIRWPKPGSDRPHRALSD
jgi:hypothetical protein